ncbi:MAG: hypothetical protein Q7S04_02560 [Candidatus Moranbacteria bacterium]|nr:hypothetical protein [Candidatus Moranbacteria bacterium]
MDWISRWFNLVVNDTLIHMNENEFPKPIPTPEQEPKAHARTNVAELSPAHTEQAPEWLVKYANEPEITQPSPEECEQKIQELVSLMNAFEAHYPIKTLYAITDLAPAAAPHHPIREPARRDLIPIVALLTAYAPQNKTHPLQIRYRYLSRAVGIINNGKVDHER